MVDTEQLRSKREMQSGTAVGALILTALLTGLAPPASAQESGGTPEGPSGGLEDIIVTARKTEERLETVPFAISAFPRRIWNRRAFARCPTWQASRPASTFAASPAAPRAGTTGRTSTSTFAGSISAIRPRSRKAA